jgi:hypothetical protein
MNRFARLVLTATLLGVPAGAAWSDEAPPSDLPPDNAALQYWQGSASVSEATKKRLEEYDTVALQGDALADVSDDNRSIAFVHAGAAMAKCDWGLDLRKGSELLVPHLHMTRILGRQTLMRARYRFEQGRWHDGLDDVLATFEMAKDAGDTPIMISLLVRYNIEQSAIDTLARHLDKMDRPTLDELAKALETIPAPDQFNRVFPTESKYFIGWVLERLDQMEKESAGDAAKWSQAVLSSKWLSEEDAAELRRVGVPPPAEMKAALGSAKQLLVEEERISERPVAEQDPWLAGIQTRFGGKPIMQKFVAAQQKSFLVRRGWQARHAMLKAAVAVKRDGEGTLQDKTHADPFGDGSFAHRKTDGGFELQSMLVVGGKPVALTIGKS